MRRILVLIAALLVCLTGTHAAAGSWSVPSNNSGSSNQSYVYSVSAKLIDDLATRSGPSTSYTGCGSYKMKGQTVKVLSRAYDQGGVMWVEVEFSYGGGYRRAWTGAKRLNLSSAQLASLPEEDFSSYIGYGTLNSSTAPRFGPGNIYAAYGDRDYYRGNRVAVIDSLNGYYKVESYHTDGKILRSWIPAACVNLD